MLFASTNFAESNQQKTRTVFLYSNQYRLIFRRIATEIVLRVYQTPQIFLRQAFFAIVRFSLLFRNSAKNNF